MKNLLAKIAAILRSIFKGKDEPATAPAKPAIKVDPPLVFGFSIYHRFL